MSIYEAGIGHVCEALANHSEVTSVRLTISSAQPASSPHFTTKLGLEIPRRPTRIQAGFLPTFPVVDIGDRRQNHLLLRTPSTCAFSIPSLRLILIHVNSSS